MQDRLKLTLSHGNFSILMEAHGVQCSYTERGGTSRFGTCTPLELVVFAMGILENYGPAGDLKIKVGV